MGSRPPTLILFLSMAGRSTTLIDDAIKVKMSQLCRRIARPAVNSVFRWNVDSFLVDTFSSVRRFFKSIWDRISPSCSSFSSSSSSSASCFSAFIVISHRRDISRDTLSGSRRRISNNVNDSSGRSGSNDRDVARNSTSGSCQYTRLQGSSPRLLQRQRRRRQSRVSGPMAAEEEDEEKGEELAVRGFELERSEFDSDYDDLVPLKISCLGDCNIGKTTFVVKYIGDEQEKNSLQMTGLNLMDKTLLVEGARIAFSIWDVGGDHSSMDHLPIACKDAVAILFMFDLTSRCTLHNVIGWFSQARKWNKTAIPVLIGTKFDDFARLPPDLQSTIITQARAYARAMKATLFFSSATHNINVNKIFKFIMAKLFNLPWTPQRNLNVGEPIIDFF